MHKQLIIGALGLLVMAWPVAATAQEETSIWDGVSNEAQAERGKIFYNGVCAKCHGDRGDGAGEPDQPQAPAVARFSFLRKWDGQSLATLFEYVKNTMPPDNPRSRSDQEYIDAIAHMLVLTGVPAGESELPPDPEVLDFIVIGPKPE